MATRIFKHGNDGLAADGGQAGLNLKSACGGGALPQNVRVLKSGNLFFALLLLLMAGCSTTSRRSNPPPEWEGTNVFQPVPPTNPPAPAPKSVPLPTQSKPAPTNVFTTTWIPLDAWSHTNGLAAPLRISGVTQASYAVTTPRGVLALKGHSRVAHWNGMELQLGYAPQETNGRFLLHSLDLEKNLQPLLKPTTPLPEKSHRAIVIDPGHGGINTGAKSVLGEHFEKEYTLDWALRLKPLLEARGWTVFLSRSNDVEVSLSNRVAFAEAHHADFFLSLHFNAPPRPAPEARGLETYCLTPAGMPSNLVRDADAEVSQNFPNNAFDEQNLQYAVRLHRALLAVNGNEDRGVSHARFLGVLRRQNRPAVLVEGGFLSNPREARHIADPAYRQKLAMALAEALN